jgi:hypothetical protein
MTGQEVRNSQKLDGCRHRGASARTGTLSWKQTSVSVADSSVGFMAMPGRVGLDRLGDHVDARGGRLLPTREQADGLQIGSRPVSVAPSVSPHLDRPRKVPGDYGSRRIERHPQRGPPVDFNRSVQRRVSLHSWNRLVGSIPSGSSPPAAQAVTSHTGFER